MDEARATELIEKIGARILNDPEFSDSDWEGLALIIHVAGGVSLSGFKYTAGGVVPTTCQDYEIHDLFLDLLEATTDAASPPWKACLVQIHGDTLEMQIDFEHDDPDRWRVTPANLSSLAEELRPEAD